MGAGKSCVGRTLAQKLNWTFEDLDDRIEQREGRTVAEIFRASGEQEFRRAERDALRQALHEFRGKTARIVALGGGAFVQEENAKLLRAAAVPTVFLDAPVEELWRRCLKQRTEANTERPLMQTMEEFCWLYQQRQMGYSQALFRIETSNRSLQTVANEIAQVLDLKKTRRSS
jgi:shikimate kinase